MIARTAYLAGGIVLCSLAPTFADTFGSGEHQFEIEFVTIGDPGNPDDTRDPRLDPVGRVDYAYRIGKYEVSAELLDKVSVAAGVDIFQYESKPREPAQGVAWVGAAMFVNWLNVSSGYLPAYRFPSNGYSVLAWSPGVPGYDPANPFRNSEAVYFLPTEDEWYKAAYYDPLAEVYYDYSTGSNEAPDGIDFPGDPDFDAVFGDGVGGTDRKEFDDVGVLSPYGTAGQGGSVAEWNESADHFNRYPDLRWNGSAVMRGGSWAQAGTAWLHSERSNEFNRQTYIADGGFRVMSRVIPEPCSAALLTAAVLTLLVRRR